MPTAKYATDGSYKMLSDTECVSSHHTNTTILKKSFNITAER